MLNRIFSRKRKLSMLMAVLTISFCLILADGIIGISAPYNRETITLPGRIVFWAFLIGLPVVFSIWISPVDTFINIPVFYLLYFPVQMFFAKNNLYLDRRMRGFFMNQGGFDVTPPWLDGILTTVIFFVIQFATMCAVILIRFLGKKLWAFIRSFDYE